MSDNNAGEDLDEMNRGRGILSKADREYLRGEKDLSTQSERDARYRIRNRVRNGLLDFHYLADDLDATDREQVFGGIDPITLIPVMEFLYKGIHDGAEDFDDTKDLFEVMAMRAVREALVDLDTDHIIEDVDVTVTIDRSTPELDALREKLEAGDESVSELRYLLNHAEVPDGVKPNELVTRILQNAEAVETVEKDDEDDEVQIMFDSYEDVSALMEMMHLQSESDHV